MTRLQIFALGAIAALAALPIGFFSCGGGGVNGNTGGSTGSSQSSSKSTAATMCTGGQEDCGGQCVDLQNDLANCGACNTACDSGALCCAGACVTTASCSFSVTSSK